MDNPSIIEGIFSGGRGNEIADGAIRSQQQGRGPSFDLSAGSLGYAVGSNDFFPGGFRPAESRTTQVGKYGGAPIFAATQSYPTNVIASRLQGIAKQQQEVNKAIQDFDPMAGVEDVNAPEYREPFVNAVNQDVKGYVNDIVTMHGRKQGYGRLMDKGSPERMELNRRVQDWNTTARYMNQATKAADAVIEGMRAGTLEADPELLKDANAVRRKLGDYEAQRDPKELAKMLPNFVGKVEFYDHLKKTGIQDMLKSVKTTEELVQRVQGGAVGAPGFTTWLTTSKGGTPEELVESLTESLYPMYSDVLSKEQVKSRIAGLASHITKEELKAVKTPGYEDALKAGREAKKDGITLGVNIRPHAGGSTLAVIPQRKGLPLNKIVVDNPKTGQGTEDLYAPALAYDPIENRPVITGRSLTAKNLEEARRSLITVIDADADMTEDQKKARKEAVTEVDVVKYAQKNNFGKVQIIPVGEGKNATALETNWGSRDPYEVFANVLAGQGIKKTATEVRDMLLDPNQRKQVLDAFGTTESTQPKQAPHGPTVTQNNVTYTWNPATGQYE
jgi:hypothetical protein